MKIYSIINQLNQLIEMSEKKPNKDDNLLRKRKLIEDTFDELARECAERERQINRFRDEIASLLERLDQASASVKQAIRLYLFELLDEMNDRQRQMEALNAELEERNRQ